MKNLTKSLKYYVYYLPNYGLKKKLNNYREALKAVSTLLKIAGALTIVGFIVTVTGITIGLKN